MKAPLAHTTTPAEAARASQAAPQADLRASTAQRQQLQEAIANSPRQLARSQQAAAALPTQPRQNLTGLPDALKSGVENLSGYSLDDVRVHYNSAQPAQLRAHAYAQGTDIHVAPGQEQHLPHEAWHVVQQKQGRVRATTQLKGQGLSDDAGLEREADQMGRRAAQAPPPGPAPMTAPAAAGSAVVQRKVFLLNSDENIYQDSAYDGLELAYLGDMGDGAGKRPLFMTYKELIDLQGAGLARWESIATEKKAGMSSARAEKYEPGSKPYDRDYGQFFEAYVREEHFNERKQQAFFEAHQFYYENEKGELKALAVNSAELALVLVARLKEAIKYGPRYRDVGGGSRLPRANGQLVIHKQPGSTHALSKAMIMDAVGITEEERGKYDGVREQEVSSAEDFARLYGEAAAQPGHQVDERGNKFFYKSAAGLVRSKNARITAAGKSYDEGFSTVEPDGAVHRTLEESFRSLGVPAAKGWQLGTALSARNREDGQAIAMKKWNALGAAAYANRFHGAGFPLTQNWEWLHIQGAQIGGETQAGNLIAGTFATNSAMIPFENDIAKWAVEAPMQLKVRFSTEGGRNGFATRIVIDIAADQHPSLGSISESTPMRVTFDPVSTAVADKFSGKLLEKQREFQRQNKQLEQQALEEELARQQKEELAQREAEQELITQEMGQADDWSEEDTELAQMLLGTSP